MWVNMGLTCCHILYGKLNKCLWCPHEAPIFPYSLCQNYSCKQRQRKTKIGAEASDSFFFFLLTQTAQRTVFPLLQFSYLFVIKGLLLTRGLLKCEGG